MHHFIKGTISDKDEKSSHDIPDCLQLYMSQENIKGAISNKDEESSHDIPDCLQLYMSQENISSRLTSTLAMC